METSLHPDDPRGNGPDPDGVAALHRMHAHVSAPDYLEQIAVFYLVFGVFLGTDRGIDNYITWLMIGVFVFGLTSRSVLAGATSITSNLGLMRAMRFPRALLPMSAVFGRLVTFGFELCVLGVVAVITGAGLTQRLVFLPVIVLAHTGLNVGLALIAARLNDSYRDVQPLIPFVFRLLMYVTGVMFPVRRYIDDADAPALIKRIVSLNPMVQLVRPLPMALPANRGGPPPHRRTCRHRRRADRVRIPVLPGPRTRLRTGVKCRRTPLPSRCAAATSTSNTSCSRNGAPRYGNASPPGRVTDGASSMPSMASRSMYARVNRSSSSARTVPASRHCSPRSPASSNRSRARSWSVTNRS